MPLTLRRVTGHPQARDAYRVVYQGREIGSVGLVALTSTATTWQWALDTILPPVGFPTRGEADGRETCMTAFKVMWEHFSSDGGRLAEFLAGYRP